LNFGTKFRTNQGMEELLSSVPFSFSVLECTKVMQISFEKIVASKQQRGGARLHRNLMVLHVLQRARDQARQSAFSFISPASDDDEESSFSNEDDEKPPLIYVHDDDPLPLDLDESELSSSNTAEEEEEPNNGINNGIWLHDQIQKKHEENFSSDFYCRSEQLLEVSKISSVGAELYSSKGDQSIFSEDLKAPAVEVEELIIHEHFSMNSSNRKRKTPDPPVGEEFYDAEHPADSEKNSEISAESGADYPDCFIMKKKACLESTSKFSSSPISNLISLVGLNLNNGAEAESLEGKENSGGNTTKNSCMELPRSMTWPLADIACWS